MRARVRRVGTSAVLKLSGKIAIGSGNEEMGEAIATLLEEGAKRVVIDLERVSYIDSSGLGTIVACRRTALEAGAEIALLRPVGKVADLLKLTGLDQVFHVYDDEEASIEEV